MPRWPVALISIADPERAPLPPAARLATLFGLAGRESAVALGIAVGQELKDVAAALGLTTLTARQYLSRALQKTEASRQHDLARMLVALEWCRTDPPGRAVGPGRDNRRRLHRETPQDDADAASPPTPSRAETLKPNRPSRPAPSKASDVGSGTPSGAAPLTTCAANPVES